MEYNITKGSQDQFCLQNIQSVAHFFTETPQVGSLFYLIVPRDVK